MNYFVYILRNEKGVYYTGITTDLAGRLNRHNKDRGGKFTKNKGPFSLVYYEVFADLSSAMRRERQIKCYSRKKKEDLIRNFNKVI